LNIFNKIVNRFLNTPDVKRSPQWNKVRKDWLEHYNSCESCGSIKNLNVHHIKPFHLYPELELDTSNFITLCENSGMNCHLFYGHFGNWSNWNPNVVQDVDNYYNNKQKNNKTGKLPEDLPD
jgi:hypothetical protein